MIHNRPPYSRPQSSRGGATLTEVLMSMLIMSIGVSFVAAVFPLSVLKSIQSTQMTSATILQYQATALIDMMPDIVHNPDGDTGANAYREHFNTDYIVDPWGYHTHLGDDPTDANGYAVGFGTRANTYPGLRVLPRFDAGISVQVQGIAPAAIQSERAEALAATLTASTDRWGEHVNTESVSVTTRSATFGAEIDLSGVPVPLAPTPARTIPDPEVSRITIFSADGRTSQAYPITNIDGQTVSWSEDFDGDGNIDTDMNLSGGFDDRQLPASFGTSGISHVIIESSRMRQFSWMLSVRKRGDGTASVDAAVVYNREVSAKNEHAYRANFVEGENLVLVEYTGDTFEGNEVEPFLKKGGYVLDANNARWYRIQDVQKRPTFGWNLGDYDAVCQLETPVVEASGEDIRQGAAPFFNQSLDAGEDANGDGTFQFGTAIFLPGVIQVYPLGNKSLPLELR